MCSIHPFLIFFIILLSLGTSRGLKCQKSICVECDGEGQWWDENTQKCFLLESQPCIQDDSDPASPKCAPNSNCHKLNGISRCVCNSGLVSNSLRHCFLGFDDDCDPSIQPDFCDSHSFLLCSLSGKCECADGINATYVPASGQCQLLVNSHCDPDPSNTKFCIENSVCSPNGKCECNPPFSPNENSRTCVLPFLAQCSSTPTDYCDSSRGLICSSNSGLCECESGIYDLITKSCLLSEGMECTVEGGSGECGPKSSCLRNSGILKCQCHEGLIPNGNGQCFHSFNATCDPFSRPDLCDSSSFLHCGKKGRCECQNPNQGHFNVTTGLCQLIIGAQCSQDSNTQKCVDTAICDGKCICEPGLIPNQNKLGCSLPYDSICSPTNDLCSTDKFLECDPTTTRCACANKDYSFYDLKTEVCALMADTPCVENEQQCGSKSSCLRSSGIFKCVCNEGLIANGINGQCFLPFNATCDPFSHPDLCDFNADSKIHCGLQGRCECVDPTNTIYIEGECQLLISAKCMPGEQNCVDDSFCDEVTGRCKCNDEFRTSKDRQCSLPIGAPCSDLLDKCSKDSGLECNPSGHCRCSNPTHTIYDDRVEKCVHLAGSQCSSNQPCAPNSKCFENNGRSTCKCLEGLEPNQDRLCFVPFNQSCAGAEREELCDPLGFLTCDLSLTCSCKDSKDSWFDDRTRTCKRLVGSSCVPKLPGDLKIEECVENSICGNENVCECSSSFPGMGELHMNSERQCALRHNEPCLSTNDLCDKTKGFQCSSFGKCTCLNEQNTWYDANTETCFLLHGFACGDTGGQCAPNSYCDQFTKKCKCRDEQFIANSDGRCFLPYSANCSSTNDLCDPNGFLSCEDTESESRCKCNSPYQNWYDPIHRVCRLTADSPCDPFGKQTCVDYSTCEMGGGPDLYKCKCREDLGKNKVGNCVLPYNSTCDHTEEVDLCDPEGFLICSTPEDTCDCRYPDTIFHPMTNACQRIPGSSCLQEEREPQCVQNSHCDLDSKQCNCKDGYNPTQVGTCLPSYGMHCNSSSANPIDEFNSSCNYFNNLDCIGNLCECKSGYYESNSDASSIRCYPGYLQPCEQNENGIECSLEANLICSAQNICSCPFPSAQVFDQRELTCLSLAGGQCTRNNIPNQISYPCHSNSICEYKNNGDLFGECKCMEGYEANSQKICSGSVSLNITVRLGLSLLFLIKMVSEFTV